MIKDVNVVEFSNNKLYCLVIKKNQEPMRVGLIIILIINGLIVENVIKEKIAFNLYAFTLEHQFGSNAELNQLD